VLAEAAGIVKKSAALSGLTYLVVGNGSLRKKIDETAAEYGMQNEFIRFERAEHENLRYFYSAMDVFIFPTLKESLGLVGIEAMACGVPVIGSRLGSLGEYIIEGRTGFFFNPGDAEDLASKIKLYYGLGPAQRSKMSENAIKMAANFDSAAAAGKLAQKFKSMFEAETNEKHP
ncbi:MAG TPA: glycosyltransferase, partial [Candidatus Wallbacteria bacterium]|nr:glycosyltransferase [Candidatus Wallbacteria bacterium]